MTTPTTVITTKNVTDETSVTLERAIRDHWLRHGHVSAQPTKHRLRLARARVAISHAMVTFQRNRRFVCPTLYVEKAREDGYHDVVLFVDYLQKVPYRPPIGAPDPDTPHSIGHFVGGLKDVALGTGVPIVAVAA